MQAYHPDIEKYRLSEYILINTKLTDERKGCIDGTYYFPHKELYIACNSTGRGRWEQIEVVPATYENGVIILKDREPYWKELCWAKNYFFTTAECCVIYFPPIQDWIGHEDHNHILIIMKPPYDLHCPTKNPFKANDLVYN
jgi:hypothetical protein